MNTAEYLIKRLEELGINNVFGVPGDYNFDLIYPLENHPAVKWTGCTNELNAGYAADGYARLKGYGAVITTYGVGELSVINAVAGAYAENIPLINIVGTPATKSISKKERLHHNFQDVNYYRFMEAYKSVTAACVFLTRDNAKLEIDRAIKVLIKEKKPVYLAIPSDIAKMEISDRNVTYEWMSDKDTLEEAVAKISEKINKSKNPIILGDVLIKRFSADIEYKEFVLKAGIPVTNFLMGTNITDMSYEKYLGGYFGEYKNPIVQKYLNDTDCLIAVGVVYNDLNSFGMTLPYKINNHIAIYGTYTYIDGKKFNNIKMSDVLKGITEKIDTKEIKIEKINIGYKHKYAENEPITSDFIYTRLQEFFKEKDIVFAETGTIPYGIAQTLFPKDVDIEFQSMWGSIGWATPAVLGANLAKPKSRVILITGEGAHQMTAIEIGNMLRCGIKPIIIVINNKGYTTERLISNNQNAGFHNTIQINYSKFSRAFEGDIWATKVVTAEDFDKALKVTQIMNKMCYIEVCTDFLDAPSILKDFAESAKKKKEKEIAPQTITPNNNTKKNFEDIELTATSSNTEFETVVHKVIPMYREDEGEEE